MNDENRRSILKCVHCGTCRAYCPVFNEYGWESTNARGRMLIAQQIDDDSDIDDSFRFSLDTCTTCGICEQMCPSGATPPDIVENARAAVVRKAGASKAQEKLKKDTVEWGNPLRESRQRLHWLEPTVREELPDKCEYVYFAGCMTAYRYPEVARKTFDILRKFGVGVLQDEVCCGSPLLRTGSDASELIEHNMEQIKKSGAKTIITGCAGCYTTLKKDYPDEFEVLHLSEFLEQKLDELDIRKLDISVSYHDPCHIGRAHGIYEAPRNVIRRICNLEEMDTHHENARCCGGGGGVRRSFSDLSRSLASKRLDEIPEKAELLVTSCPLCRSNLEMAAEDREIIDLIELLEKAIC